MLHHPDEGVSPKAKQLTVTDALNYHRLRLQKINLICLAVRSLADTSALGQDIIFCLCDATTEANQTA